MGGNLQDKLEFFHHARAGSKCRHVMKGVFERVKCRTGEGRSR